MKLGAAILALLLAAGTMSACSLLKPSVPTAPKPESASQAPPPAPPRVVRLIVPKPVKCVPDEVGPPPVYPDSDAALRDAGGAADRYQLLAAGRILRQQRLQRLEDIVKRCRTAGR
jgi:hypothetical protein